LLALVRDRRPQLVVVDIRMPPRTPPRASTQLA
jgi:hypothetical protein